MLYSPSVDIFDLKQMSTDGAPNIPSWTSSQHCENLRWSIIHYHLGLSRLEGEGQLKDIWPELEMIVQQRGKVAVIMKDDELRIVPVSIVPGTEGGLYPVLEVVVAEGPDGPIKEYYDNNPESNYVGKIGRESKYALLKNNMYERIDRIGIDSYLKSLVYILDAIFYDIELSKKNLVFILPERPEEEDMEYNLKMFNKKVFSYITFERSQNPSQKQIEGGKQGILPQDVKYVLNQPQSKERDNLWRDYDNIFRMMLRIYGVRHDSLMKEERVVVDEVKGANSHFDNWENERAVCRLRFIRRVMLNWGGDYTLHYAGKRRN